MAGVKLARALVDGFTKNGNPEKAAGMAKYLRNQFPCLGITAPVRRTVMKEVLKEHPVQSSQELFEAAKQLWVEEPREAQQAAVDLLRQYSRLWPTDKQTLAVFQEFIVTKSWWDTVDMLASNCVGKLVLADIMAGGAVGLQKEMDEWAESSNMWMRRTAIIHQLTYRKEVDEKRLFSYCESCMEEKEFFIRKAIGWALRSYSKDNPEAVRSFIATHRANLSGLSIREASKYI